MKQALKFDTVFVLMMSSAVCLQGAIGNAPTTPQEVRIDAGNIAHYSLPPTPVEKLASALRGDKTSPRFRVTWYSFLSSSNINYTAVYDRRKRDLKFYSAGLLFEKKVRSHYHYTGVTDRTIYRLANQSAQSDARPNDSFFSQLQRYGCKRYRLP